MLAEGLHYGVSCSGGQPSQPNVKTATEWRAQARHAQVILVDANVLIYAIDSDSPHHVAARRWLEHALSATTPIGLAWTVILAFLRLTTRAGILRHPLPPERAVAFVDEWLDQPYVRTVGPGEAHWTILRQLLRQAGMAGNLASDAHLAAIALELGASVCSTDADFERFPGVERVGEAQGLIHVDARHDAAQRDGPEAVLARRGTLSGHEPGPQGFVDHPFQRAAATARFLPERDGQVLVQRQRGPHGRIIAPISEHQAATRRPMRRWVGSHLTIGPPAARLRATLARLGIVSPGEA